MTNPNIASRLDKLGGLYRALVASQPQAELTITMAELPEQVYNSNAIENSTLTLKDTEDIILRGQIQRDAEVREIYEAKNLARAMTLLAENPRQNLTTELILALHNILLTGISDHLAGRFRSGDEWVRVGSHVGANPDFVSQLVYQLVENYNHSSEREFLANIAYFHAEFEFIHPFGDGNGRIGRVLMNQQLMRLGWPPVIIHAKNKHQEYYPMLDAYDHGGSTTELEDYLALLLLESLNKRITILMGKRTILLSDWAKNNNISPSSAINKAKRQTIPAFRDHGKWRISADFTDDPAATEDALSLL